MIGWINECLDYRELYTVQCTVFIICVRTWVMYVQTAQQEFGIPYFDTMIGFYLNL